MKLKKKKKWFTPRIYIFNDNTTRSGNLDIPAFPFEGAIPFINTLTHKIGDYFAGGKILCTVKAGEPIIINTPNATPTCASAVS